MVTVGDVFFLLRSGDSLSSISVCVSLSAVFTDWGGVGVISTVSAKDEGGVVSTISA